MVTALLGDEVDLTISSVQAFLPHIAGGKIRALLVTSPKRSPTLPNVTTTAEIGLPNFDMSLNFGLWAPAETPTDIIARLSGEAATALRNPAVIEQIRKGSAAEAVGSTPEGQLRAFESEVQYWTEASRLANFHPQ